MLHNIYAVWDDKAQAYLPTFVSQTDATAERAFFHSLATPETGLAVHPGDYSLYAFGYWDDNTGIYDVYERPKCIANGKNWVKRESAD